MSNPIIELPIFPLGNVLFPDGLLALNIFEPRYVQMVQACLRNDSVFGVCLIRAGYEVGMPAIPCTLGCTARIIEHQQPMPERYALMALGESRFRIISRRSNDSGLIIAQVEMIEPAMPITLPADYAHFSLMLERVIETLGEQQFAEPHLLDDADWVANRIAELLPVTPERRQQWLENNDVLERLIALEEALQELP